MNTKKHATRCTKQRQQRDIEIRDGIEVQCIGLENIPVTNAELEVLETYAGDLIIKFVQEHINKQKE